MDEWIRVLREHEQNVSDSYLRSGVVVIADADGESRRRLERILARQWHGAIVNAASHIELFQRIAEYQEMVSLVIIDASMPVVNGYQLSLMLRSRYALSELPIALATTEPIEEIERRAERYTIDCIIRKPYEPTAARTLIEQCARFIPA